MTLHQTSFREKTVPDRARNLLDIVSPHKSNLGAVVCPDYLAEDIPGQFIDIVFEKEDYNFTIKEEKFINESMKSIEDFLLSQNFKIIDS